ncbi:MAG: hypothetical protein U9P44_01025 [archaeon]|nr:hypothetical protein [archaeon]
MNEAVCLGYFGFGKSRKGQFFVIGIVIILFSLVTLNGILNQDSDLELSYMQEDRTVYVIKQMESDLFDIISIVEYKSVPCDIEEYLVYEKAVLSRFGYTLEFEKDVTYIGQYPNNIFINYTIKSSNINIRREIKTNAWCVRYEYNDLCASLDLVTNGVVTAAKCCSDFGLCC